MDPPLPWLRTIPEQDLPAKARRLAALARAGLPVPRGLVVTPDPSALDDPELCSAIESLLARGPVVVRSALAGEDEADFSGAGLGRSQLGCRDLGEVAEALARLGVQREDPWLAVYRRDATTSDLDRVLIQEEVTRRLLLVIALPSDGGAEVEVHARAGEVLAEGHSPTFAGPLARWDNPARVAVEALVARTSAKLEASLHGHDLEIVIDPEDRVHLVQARPLTAALHPGWPAFRDALAHEGSLDRLHGVLTLDAEHNPAPLSPAHAWLMEWLRSQRANTGDPTVLAGWLYVRTLPRKLGRSQTASSSAREVIEQLHGQTLPDARSRLEQLQRELEGADASEIAQALPRAQRSFLAMIDVYVGVLIPARTQARRATDNTIVTDLASPLSTRGRDEFLDVLPATWDLASPSLAELGATKTRQKIELPRDEATAATLLGEWDDHLFALGLAPLRDWFRAAGRWLGLHEDVFMLSAPEVLDALGGRLEGLPERIVERRERHDKRAALRPPLRIEDGRPVSFGRRAHLRGIPIGPSFEGTLAPRADLDALLADPPLPDAIVILPALTAPAAVALRQLGIRAVCCEHGGALSHAALMARELGLAALIGCRGCTTLPAGRRARLDTTTGRLLLAPR